MTPQQKIKHMILNLCAEWAGEPAPEVTAENIDELYAEAVENDQGSLQDARNEIRSSGEETRLPTPSSRHYEVDAVAAQAPDGSWVGWNYWHGGGKHAEPEAIDWIGDAYDVRVTGERSVIVRTFEQA